MLSRCSGFLFLMLVFTVSALYMGVHLVSFIQPPLFAICAAVYGAFYLVRFGFRNPSTIPPSRIQKTALEAFWPSIVMNLGIQIGHTRIIATDNPQIEAIFLACAAFCTTYSVFFLVAMMSLGKRE